MALTGQAKTDYQRHYMRRLRAASDVSPGEWKKLRKQVLKRDGFVCVYCEAPDSVDCDHVVPVSRGGPTILENVFTACKRCNLEKGIKDVASWLASNKRLDPPPPHELKQYVIPTKPYVERPFDFVQPVVDWNFGRHFTNGMRCG
jgi:5-methylcytosine-specific restriction endonuclease McrA